jgi:hypothetical protein
MRFRSLLALLIVAFALPSRATEYTDLWWNPAESGWGLTVTQQGSVAFLTLFVYGADGKATWFSSPATFQANDSNGNPTYSGPLFQSTGPAFSATYDAAAVHATAMGTASFTATGSSSADLAYTVSGVSVSKSLIRQTFRNNDLVVGNFIGGLVVESFTCPFAIVGNGNGREGPMNVYVTGPAGTDIQIDVGDGSNCSTRGDYVQQGRLGRVEGTYTCKSGDFGTSIFFEMEANNLGLSTRYVLSSINGCREIGHYTGARMPGSP